MKKKVLVIISALLFMMLFTPVVPYAKAEISGIPKWIDPVYSGYDIFYDEDVNAYLVGTEATVLITIYNQYGDIIDDLTIEIEMDWGDLEKLELNNIDLGHGRYYTAEMKIPVPTDVNTRIPHRYTIRLEYDFKIMSSQNETYRYPDPDGGYFFAAISQAQKDAKDLAKEVRWLQSAYSPYRYYSYYFFLISSEARQLWANATLYIYLADENYDRGRFDDAKEQYGIALNLTKQAIDNDIELTRNFETVFIELLGSFKDLMAFQGWAYLLVGIGFLLMGIGVVVYLVRRSGHKAPPATSP